MAFASGLLKARRSTAIHSARGSFARAATKSLCVAAACAAAFGASSAVNAAELGKVGLGLPLLTSPFWQSYNNYLGAYAKQDGIDILAPVNSNNDPAQQITDMNNMINLGAKGIVVGPIDSAAISRALGNAAQKDVKVVAVDVAPTQGNVAMVVRADNRAYGEQACKYIGEHVKSGKVVQIMGDLASVNGRDRSEAFRACLKNYPNLSLLEIPAAWKGDVAASALDSLLTANPDVKGIYMQAGCDTVASISPLRIASNSCGMPSLETITMCFGSPAGTSNCLRRNVCSVGERYTPPACM